MNLTDLAKNFSTEEAAIKFLESKLWPDGPVCPKCGLVKEAYEMHSKEDSKNKMRLGLWKCSNCRKTFRVTVNTIFEDSHIPLHKWMMAIHLMCASKKGISAHQLHRMLGLGYRAAWFMAHRIRYAMGPGLPLGKLLTGTVEVDETFIGGKGDIRTKASRKTPVVALIERDGEMRTRVVSNVTQKNLKVAIKECVDQGAIINTDDSAVYRGQLKTYARHDVVNHSAEEYARVNLDGTVSHVNSAESFFSLLKRGVVGAWHHVSREHLPKYANEFEFRWNHRKTTDGERMRMAIRAVGGRRLTYRPLTSLRAKKAVAQRKAENEQPRRIFREPTRL